MGNRPVPLRALPDSLARRESVLNADIAAAEFPMPTNGSGVNSRRIVPSSGMRDP